MKYTEFEKIISEKRLRRYLQACKGDTRKAMTLYRYNIYLSEDMFAIICHFEVALRNAIDNHLTPILGNDWIRNSVMQDGVFTLPVLHSTRDIIYHAYKKLLKNDSYSHTKLLAEMDFGVWKYMFSPIQYRQTGQSLLQIFPYKERSSVTIQYNHSFIFNELDRINTLRNRIAHHEPICFSSNNSTIYTEYILNEYNNIMRLFKWMGIDSKDLLFGLDHVIMICEKMDRLNCNKKQNPPV